MIADLKELFLNRDLLFNLTVREVKIRYKQTLLGLGWAIVQPLAMMVIFTVIFSRFLSVKSEGFPYPIFSYSALLFWTFFSTSLSFAPNAMLRMADLIKKIYFPREIIPLSAILAAFFDMLISSVIFIAMMIWYRIPVSINLLFIPILILVQVVFTVGVVLILSALNTYYRDVRYAIPFLVQIWMYATPIVFSLEAVPEKLRPWYLVLNPMAGLIDSYRRVILHRAPPELVYLLIAAAVSLCIAAVSYVVFKKMEGTFADVI